MIYYVIKRDDEEYCNFQQTWELRFDDNITNASFYREKWEAESDLDGIVCNEYLYHISREQLKVVKVEIKEIEDGKIDNVN